MKSSFILAAAATLLLAGCGGSSDSSGKDTGGDTSSSDGVCTVTSDVISLTPGGKCNISAATATQYNVTAGEVSCSAEGTLTYGALNSGGNINLNDLTLTCAS